MVTAPTMRVLLVHNRYQIRAGEDQVFDRELDLLRQRGHAVRAFTVTNDAIATPTQRLAAAFRVVYSRHHRDALAAVIADWRPDLVHVHNTFPLLTPSVFDACRDAGVPVVQTLHNYRLMCAAATLSRDGQVCEDCVGGSSHPAVLHRCYRQSRLGSLAVARMIDVHRRRGTWRQKVDRFIAPTAFARDRFVAAGLPADRIAVMPNFVPDDEEGDGAPAAGRQGALFVGRLSLEKGVRTLLRAWREVPDVSLTFLGDGPLRGEVEAAAASDRRLIVVGQASPQQVAAAMRRAAFLIMPSEWYETFGLVVIEAYCRGLPVIASRLGAMAELVDNRVTGVMFTPGDAGDLGRTVRAAAGDADRLAVLGRHARARYEALYTPAAHLNAMTEIYSAVLRDRCASMTARA